ncbi:hypothetical protein [Streptomyces sp. NPDC057199]|uniref:hypothetical protein n=1 Tax=Streptomyces sp. NPDC057199 TaxID=3346047 RepID=UPI00363ACD04
MYYDAVVQALEAGMYEDATEWLSAQQLVRSRSGLILQDWAAAQLAQQFSVVLRMTGRDSVLPMASDLRATALDRLLKEKYPDARQALLQYRRRAVALGSWTHEHECEPLLARLYAQVGEPLLALEHLTVSDGSTVRRVKGEIVAGLPEQPLKWLPPHDLSARPPWERGCAFLVTAAVADLLPDNAASTWIDAALCELEAGARRPARPGRLRMLWPASRSWPRPAPGRRPNGWSRWVARPRLQPRSGPVTTPGSS